MSKVAAADANEKVMEAHRSQKHDHHHQKQHHHCLCVAEISPETNELFICTS